MLAEEESYDVKKAEKEKLQAKFLFAEEELSTVKVPNIIGTRLESRICLCLLNEKFLIFVFF